MSEASPVVSCTYCHLPFHSTSGIYCCSGCRFAAAVAAETGAEGGARRTLMRLGLGIFFAMNVMVFTMAMWSYDVYGETSLDSPQAQALWELFRYLSLLFAGPVMILLGLPLLEHAFDNRWRLTSTTDSLILLGVGAAYIYSVIAVLTGDRHTYFEVACLVLVGVTLGRWLEATGRQRASEALRSLKKLLPETVRIVDPHDSRFDGKIIPLGDVVVGQWIRVLPGERVPVDGMIRRGQAAVDQQIVTGESAAAIKEFGDTVFAGTVNLDGDLLIEVQAGAEAGMLNRIIEAVERAALAKSRLQGIADRISAWFVPGVSLLAVLVFFAHCFNSGFATGLLSALAILLIACPCALGIATPMALHAAIGVAARRGVLFRNGDVLERLTLVKTICFDKTGTLTTGEPVVESVIVDEGTSRAALLAVASHLSARSNHGLSKAIHSYVVAEQSCRSDSAPAELINASLKNLPGRGVSADGAEGMRSFVLGSSRLMHESGFAFPAAIAAAAELAERREVPTVFVGWSGRVYGLFTFSEELRPESQNMLADLHGRSIETVVLTGDHTARIISSLQSAGTHIQTRLLPDEKRGYLAKLRAEHTMVAMVGDGINDAPALAEADVGIAMGCGADVSRDTADLCLLGNDLGQIPWACDLSRKTLRTIRQNLFWAFAYNVVGIGLALGGVLNPIWAAAAMVGSSLFVTMNSLRLAQLAEAGNATAVLPSDIEAPQPSDASPTTQSNC